MGRLSGSIAKRLSHVLTDRSSHWSKIARIDFS